MYKWYIRTNCINNKSAHKNEHTEQQLIERKSFYWMPKMVCSICIGRSTHANDAHMFSYSLVVVKISIEPKTFGFSNVWTYNQFWLNNTYALLRAVTVRFRFIYCIAKQTTPWVDVGLILRKLFVCWYCFILLLVDAYICFYFKQYRRSRRRWRSSSHFKSIQKFIEEKKIIAQICFKLLLRWRALKGDAKIVCPKYLLTYTFDVVPNRISV